MLSVPPAPIVRVALLLSVTPPVGGAPPPGVVTGTISNGNLLTLDDPSLLKGLVPGMVVMSPDDPSLTCFILSIDQGGQIHLSETVPAGVTHFTITNPSLNVIAGYNSNTPLFTLNFQGGQTDALAFAQTVYTLMGAFSHTTTGALFAFAGA